MKTRSRQITIAIGSVGLLGSFAVWAITNNAVNACSSWIGTIDQSVSNRAFNNCETYSIVHSLGIAGMIISIIVLAIAFIANRK